MPSSAHLASCLRRCNACCADTKTEGAMKLITKCTLLLLAALTSGAPVFAAPPVLGDPGQPGRVIIYPKFVNMPAVNVDGNSVPRTEIEIGAICPPAFVAAGGVCAPHQAVIVSFHWVCAGAEGVNSNICLGSGFQVTLSVNGKLAFSADGIPINSNSPVVPAAPCPRGYLIGTATSDQPNFDGLIGDAVIRGPIWGSARTRVRAPRSRPIRQSRSRRAPRPPGFKSAMSSLTK